jgi:hypothetical protein
MSDTKKVKEINALIEKFDTMKKQEKMDLSSDQDLSIAIMNLISIEEHLVFTGAKTGKTHFYDLIEEVREMRKNLLKMIIKEYEGEVWCISKHLLSSSMRLMEVGTKAQSRGRREEAYSFFEKAYDLYALFWGLQMNVISTDTLKDEKIMNNTEDNEIIESPVKPIELIRAENSSEVAENKRTGFMGRL